jgi:hypothetical protein
VCSLNQELKLTRGDMMKKVIKVSSFLDSGSLTGSDFVIANDLHERKGNLIKLEKNVFENAPLKVQFKIIIKK